MVLKKYKICDSCGENLPYNRTYYRRFGANKGMTYHTTCRKCEDIYKHMQEWKEGKLLCHKCYQYKDEIEFSSNSTNSEVRHNRRYICKDCYTKTQKHHNLNLDDNKKLFKCLRFRFLGARDRATKYNISFDLTYDYIVKLWHNQKGICALSGISMTYALQEGRVPTNVSIDKIDRTKGYIQGNIQLVCMACNQIKSDLTDLEMYNFCKKIVDQYESKNNINT